MKTETAPIASSTFTKTPKTEFVSISSDMARSESGVLGEMRQPTAAFATLGCKVNQYETQRILDRFEERGFRITEFNQVADVYVINTCSVTQAAERKSRQLVRRLSNQNPDAVVVMTGCYAEMARIKSEKVEDAALIVPNADKLNTLSHFLQAYPKFEDWLKQAPTPLTHREPHSRHERTRATLKIQDGCNIYCSFCSIPYTRSRMRSRPLDELLKEARQLADQGFRELVVTGVLVGSYGEATGSGGANLADLLAALTQIPGIERVRLSSIEPTQVTPPLLSAFAENRNICNHLHIPLQSGDNRVLQAMNRPYDQDFYLKLCEAAYRQIPDLAITTDIIVGFPTEDLAAFEQTVKVVESVGFARAHIFRYSPRPGTPAAAFSNPVSEAKKEARSQQIS
ncbi:MAG: tRNA (N(6)-L-threonylcarbamoyladenosine(37)-C(2))-methylthiotransferase MtaB, partial [Armatimonadetes bacterium]|nr:tRNA (N(6)-L-threonylcarbamoyladenosine(37)-C(2))-methylthiotransferase MtaB [Armatimonadota bacterium]